MSEPCTVAQPCAAQDAVRHLLDAAEKYGGVGIIGRCAVEELIARGYPDALLVPPAALEAYREAQRPGWRRVPWRVAATVSLAFVLSTAAIVGAVPLRVPAPPARPEPLVDTLYIVCFDGARPPEQADWAQHTRRVRVLWDTR